MTSLARVGSAFIAYPIGKWRKSFLIQFSETSYFWRDQESVCYKFFDERYAHHYRFTEYKNIHPLYFANNISLAKKSISSLNASVFHHITTIIHFNAIFLKFRFENGASQFVITLSKRDNEIVRVCKRIVCEIKWKQKRYIRVLHETFGKMIHPRDYMVICGDFCIDITIILEFGTYKDDIFLRCIFDWEWLFYSTK